VTTHLLNVSLSLPSGGGSIHQVVQWTETDPGAEQVWIRIDPANTTSELNENNNEVKLDVTFRAPPPSFSWPLVLVGSVALVAVAVAALVLTRRRRQKNHSSDRQT